jgi:hypothetical protein
VEGPAVFAPSLNHSNLSHPSPFVIPTEAPKERSGGICSAPCGYLNSFLSTNIHPEADDMGT